MKTLIIYLQPWSFQGNRTRLTYDGMWHLDIPKTRQYDDGKIEVVARNGAGEAICETTLTVKQREDDYRGVLKNSPRRKSANQSSFCVTDAAIVNSCLSVTSAAAAFHLVLYLCLRIASYVFYPP